VRPAMTAIDPHSQPPTPPGRPPFLVIAVVAALALGGLPARGSMARRPFSGIVSSPMESPAQQLKLGELAFKNGNDAVALNLFDHLAAQDNATAQYWARAYDRIGPWASLRIFRGQSRFSEKAAAQNSIPAQTRLGEIYLHGDLTTPD